ncbi:MAG: nucleotidyltransferase domain-containing protein, partial [Deltaproteobacteria bacterium]|nr:nucleotidyltransferase domain-containing protein [Deltaproteobacteria bacterium]
MMSKEVPKKRIVSFLTEKIPDLIAIYLFGSSVQGTPGLESDIDLAILPVQPLNPLERWNLAQDLANLLKREVDLVDLRKASTVMRMQVISSGQYLYESNRQERDRFEDYVFSSYARLNEERKEIIKKVQEQGTIYG